MSKWLMPMKQQTGASLSLFCFPFSGGSAQVFKSWGDLLPASIQVYGIQYPGRGTRFGETPITVMEEMVAELKREIQPYLHRPIAFFGHSLGGGIALDLVRALQADGQAVQHLIISGRRAAHLPRNRPLITDLPEAEFRKEVFGMGGMSKEITEHPELMDLVSPILRADLSISEKYTFNPEPKITCPLTAMGGDSDPLVEVESIPLWREHTTASFEHYIFPGAHFYIDSAREAVIGQVAKTLGHA